MPNSLLSAKDAAALLDVPHTTFCRWARQKRVPVDFSDGERHFFKLETVRTIKRGLRLGGRAAVLNGELTEAGAARTV